MVFLEDLMKFRWDSTSSVEENLKTLGRFHVLRFKVVTFLKLMYISYNSNGYENYKL